jgi:hypothetical protein
MISSFVLFVSFVVEFAFAALGSLWFADYSSSAMT